MSRVKKPGGKFMNTNTYSSKITDPGEIVWIKGEHPDPAKAKSLTDWLFLKYGISYKAFQRKSKERKDELRAEYTEETGNVVGGNRNTPRYDPEEWERWREQLMDMGLPFNEFGDPVGW